MKKKNDFLCLLSKDYIRSSRQQVLSWHLIKYVYCLFFVSFTFNIKFVVGR